MKEISSKEAQDLGVRTFHTRMDNGESRFRLICDNDHSSYVRTEAAAEGGLQNSHFHKKLKEIYIVQKGKIDFFEYVGKKLMVKTLEEGEFAFTQANVPHNVYMYPNSVIHTVKFGESDSIDRYACEELDELIKEHLSSIKARQNR